MSFWRKIFGRRDDQSSSGRGAIPSDTAWMAGAAATAGSGDDEPDHDDSDHDPNSDPGGGDSGGGGGNGGGGDSGGGGGDGGGGA